MPNYVAPDLLIQLEGAVYETGSGTFMQTIELPVT
jgi:hypothetical protein